jgi:hypothetical protein
MDWATWFCRNPHCTVATWLVQQVPAEPELWWLAQTPAESPFTVAAVDPVCPRCGTTLATLLDSEGLSVAIERELRLDVERSLVS